MCERIPADCLPPPGSLPGADEVSGEACGEGWEPWSLDRRMVLAGMASLLLTACAPARPRRRRTVAAAPRPPVPPYRLIRRAAWGAEPLKANHDPMNGIHRITLHHTAEIAGMATRPSAELVKGIQDFHRNKRGWADIGYHWVIGVDGNLYEGRSLDAQGAHAGAGKNGHNLGISVIGDFTKVLPSARQLRTTRLLLRASLRTYNVPLDDLYGHRDFKATACPGDQLYAWLCRFKEERFKEERFKEERFK